MIQQLQSAGRLRFQAADSNYLLHMPSHFMFEVEIARHTQTHQVFSFL